MMAALKVAPNSTGVAVMLALVLGIGTGCGTVVQYRTIVLHQLRYTDVLCLSGLLPHMQVHTKVQIIEGRQAHLGSLFPKKKKEVLNADNRQQGHRAVFWEPGEAAPRRDSRNIKQYTHVLLEQIVIPDHGVYAI
jgi:hypothetical protein